MCYYSFSDVVAAFSLEVEHMTAKNTTFDIDYLVSEYLKGRTQAEIAAELGVSNATVSARLNSAGIRGRRNSAPTCPARRLPLPVDDISRRYIAGESVNALAEAYLTSRVTITNRLQEIGIPIRSPLEANQLMMSNRSPEEHAKNTRAAHAAATGRKHSFEERCKMAQGRERNQSGISENERLLARMLKERGIATLAQVAVGPYNCDFAARPVAVEVWGGYFHYFGRHLARTPERTRYFLDCGWSLLIVHVGRYLRRITDDGADYVATYIEQSRSDPSFRSEYRMVWGTGELIAAGGGDDDQDAIVETLRRAKDAIRDDPLSTW
jgi:very-short-patch-repair endonuclease